MMKSFKGTSPTSLVVNSYKFSKKRSFVTKGIRAKERGWWSYD